MYSEEGNSVILTMSRERELRRCWRELLEPFVRMKCDILNANIATIRLHSDGQVESIYSPAVLSALAQVDELWAQSWNSFLNRLNSGNSNYTPYSTEHRKK